VLQIISAIHECHNRNIIHRDLKLENVLFSTRARRKIKIVDFGIAGMFAKGGISDKNEAFTLRYAAPEIILSDNSRSHPSLDVWTIGIMLYAMLFNLMPFNGTTKE